MACNSASSVAIQENQQGTHPTTSVIRPFHGRLHIIRQSRQVFDFEKVGQSRNRPNANRFYQEHGFGTSIIVQFIIGVRDLHTGELWNCTIKKKQRQLVLDNGSFVIHVTISPNGLVCFPMVDINQDKLPDYLCNVKCILPVEADEPLAYCVKISLFGVGGEKRLDFVEYTVLTHERGHDMYDYKEGRTIMEVERPQLKIKMTGLLAQESARKLLLLFQNLGDNGFYKQFYIEQQNLLRELERLEMRFGKGVYKDLKLSVKLEESVMLFGQNKMDDCIRTAKEVVDNASNLPNGAFLMSKAHTIISAVYRQCFQLDKAYEHMVLSTELLEQVVVCEETAINQYNWAALLSEKSARYALTSSEQKDAEFRFENCRLHWKEQKQNTTDRELMRNQIRSINYHLTTTRDEFPDERTNVTEESLVKALEAIKHIETNLLKTCCSRHRVTYLIAKSDYYIRSMQMNGPHYPPGHKRGNAIIAMDILKTVLNDAKELKLKNEIRAIKERMRKLLQLFWPDEVWVDEDGDEQERHDKKPIENDEDAMTELLKELVKDSDELQYMGELQSG